MLRLILTAIEPIPADDTMTESDWRVTRETQGGISSIRVIRGPEFADPKNPSGNAQAYWFATDGHLLQTYSQGLVIRPQQLEMHDNTALPKSFLLLKDGKAAMKVTVMAVDTPPSTTPKQLEVKGHEWKRAFTGETR